MPIDWAQVEQVGKFVTDGAQMEREQWFAAARGVDITHKELTL
jgi:hypothetical protein